jgi:hypothetical protein
MHLQEVLEMSSITFIQDMMYPLDKLCNCLSNTFKDAKNAADTKTAIHNVLVMGFYINR